MLLTCKFNSNYVSLLSATDSTEAVLYYGYWLPGYRQDFLYNKLRFVYLDDVLGASPNHEQHLVDLRLVLEKLQQHGFVLIGEKCQFGVAELDYLGHHVTASGIQPMACRGSYGEVSVAEDSWPAANFFGHGQLLQKVPACSCSKAKAADRGAKRRPGSPARLDSGHGDSF
jgi:hypothetical protein